LTEIRDKNIREVSLRGVAQRKQECFSWIIPQEELENSITI
jgi:hypothetical protein